MTTACGCCHSCEQIFTAAALAGRETVHRTGCPLLCVRSGCDEHSAGEATRAARSVARHAETEPMAGHLWLAIDGGTLTLGGRQWALVLDALEAYGAGDPAYGDGDRLTAAALAARLRLGPAEVGTPRTRGTPTGSRRQRAGPADPPCRRPSSE